MVCRFADFRDLVVEVLEGVLDFAKETFLVVLFYFLLLGLVFLELVFEEVVGCHGFITVTKDYVIACGELTGEELVCWLGVLDSESEEICLLFLFANDRLWCIGFNLFKEGIDGFLLFDFFLGKVHVEISKIVKCI